MLIIFSYNANQASLLWWDRNQHNTLTWIWLNPRLPAPCLVVEMFRLISLISVSKTDTLNRQTNKLLIVGGRSQQVPAQWGKSNLNCNFEEIFLQFTHVGGIGGGLWWPQGPLRLSECLIDCEVWTGRGQWRLQAGCSSAASAGQYCRRCFGKNTRRRGGREVGGRYYFACVSGLFNHARWEMINILPGTWYREASARTPASDRMGR